MLPHEKALVKRMQDKPFALVGINAHDGKAAEVKPKLIEGGINWRNAIDDEAAEPLAECWNVSGFPTLFLIDASGVIRERWLGGPGEEVLDAKIDALVAEASKKPK